MLKAIIFDLDETLLDWRGRTIDWEAHETKHLTRVHRYITEHIQPIAVDEQEFYQTVLKHFFSEWGKAKKTYIAPHLGHILVNVLVECGIPAEKLTPDLCLQAYEYELIDGVTAFPEVGEVLSELHSYPLQFGIITNALQPMMMRDIDLAGTDLLQFFPEPHYRLSAADVGYLKPHPRIFEEILERMNIQAQEAVFVGDSLTADIKGAQAAGIKAIWRKSAGEYHYQTNPDATPPTPDATLTSLLELLDILDDLFPRWREMN